MTLVDPMRPVRRRKPQPQPSQTSLTPEAPIERVGKEVKKVRRMHLQWRWLFVGVMVAALLVLPESIGQIVLICYGFVVVIKRAVVHLTFGLAVLFLVLSPILSVLTGSEGNGRVLASYSFVLLLIGFMQAIGHYKRLVKEKSQNQL